MQLFPVSELRFPEIECWTSCSRAGVLPLGHLTGLVSVAKVPCARRLKYLCAPINKNWRVCSENRRKGVKKQKEFATVTSFSIVIKRLALETHLGKTLQWMGVTIRGGLEQETQPPENNES